MARKQFSIRKRWPYLIQSWSDSVRYFPKVIFPSDNFPSDNLPKVRLETSEAPQAAMGGPSAAARTGWEPSAESRTGLRSCSLGNCTFGKLPLGKHPLGKSLTSIRQNCFKSDIPRNGKSLKNTITATLIKFCHFMCNQWIHLIGQNPAQGYPKERIKKKITSAQSGYRDLAIGIKGVQFKSFQLRD